MTHLGDITKIISIHAPAKGATDTTGERFTRLLFQFTPPRRGRPVEPTGTDRSRYFNSRPREGGDAVAISVNGEPRLFQFTPPRRGRRMPLFLNLRKASDFNSRPREGGDGCT